MSYRILIIDDSATTRAVIRRTLGMCGLEVQKVAEAANGPDGLAVLAVTRIDLVFLDLNMPGMNGAEVVARVRADPRTARLPVVIVSSESLDARVEQLKAGGASAYIKKPFTPEQIRRTAQQFLGAARAA
jgi:two-component system, chemotaxis family, chemotaxis protein CheY